jgi:hypothetical protein
MPHVKHRDGFELNLDLTVLDQPKRNLHFFNTDLSSPIAFGGVTIPERVVKRKVPEQPIVIFRQKQR